MVSQLRQQRGQAGLRLGVVRVESDGAAAVGNGLQGWEREDQWREGGGATVGSDMTGPWQPKVRPEFETLHPPINPRPALPT